MEDKKAGARSDLRLIAIEDKEVKTKRIIHRVDDNLFFVAVNQEMIDIYHVLLRLAPTVIDITLLGETGVGKDLLAYLIHQQSKRKGFIECNIPNLNPNLIESELFGYKKGAFTGADKDQPGWIRTAHKGTLFLNEIADLPLAIQVKLLKLFDHKMISRVGEANSRPVDVRIISATNRNLEEILETGEFRKDLYFRMGQMITIPPLRERAEDILPIANHFVNRFSKEFCKGQIHLSSNAKQYLLKHDWPGNVRELENIIKTAVSICKSDKSEVIDIDELEVKLKQNNFKDEEGRFNGSELSDEQEGETTVVKSIITKTSTGDFKPLKEIKKEAADFAEGEFITQVLKETDWNRKKAAKKLRVSYKALLYKIKELGLKAE